MSLRDVGKVKPTTIVTLTHPDPAQKLRNPDGSPMTVVLHGPYSDRYKTILREQQQRRMAEMADGANVAAMTPDELDEYSRELLAKCVESWNIWLDEDEELIFSPDKVDEVLDEHPWIRDQLNAALGRTSRFLEPRSKP